MFRIQKGNSNLLKPQRSGLEKLRRLWNLKNFRVIGGTVLVLVAGYLVWTHGHLLPKSQKAVLDAEASSPLPPEWLNKYFGVKVCDRSDWCGPQADPDKDGLTNYEEFLFYTNPTNPDTDGDGKTDGEEVKNLDNPIGTGPLGQARDITNLYQSNPIQDDLMQIGAEGVKNGDVLTVDEIQAAAQKISQLPDFHEIPFKIGSTNNQAAVDAYVQDFTKLLAAYQTKPASIYGNYLSTVTDGSELNDFRDAISVYATSLTMINVPSDLLAFHKAYYGSLVMQGLTADKQLEVVQGKTSENDAQAYFQTYQIYYTRFIQDMQAQAEQIKTKYNFILDLSAVGNTTTTP